MVPKSAARDHVRETRAARALTSSQQRLGPNSLHTSTMASPNPGKRSRSEMEEDERPTGNPPAEADDGRENPPQLFFEVALICMIDSSSDDDFGPALPSDAPKKKRRRLPYESLYIAALPTSPRYSKSLMHRDQLSFVTLTPYTDFLITSSVDGVVKFWKKVFGGIDFVKEFKAHTGEITSVSVSADGRSFATAGDDNSIKIFDVITFGMTLDCIC